MDLYITYYSYDILTQVNLDTLTREADLPFAVGDGDSVEDCVVYSDYLIVGRNPGGGGIAGELVRIDLTTFTEVAPRLVLPELNLGNGSPHCCMVVVGNILYIAVDDPAPGVLGGIVRVNLDTWARIDRLDLADRRPHITTDGTNLYVGYYVIAGIDRIDRVNLATFAIDNTLNLTNPETMAMYVHEGSLYTTHGTGPAPDIVTRIDLATFAETGNLTLGVGEAWGYALISDGTYLYCGCASGVGLPGYLVRIDQATFTRIDSIIFPVVGGEDDVWSLFIYNNFIWVLTEDTPGSVVRVDIPTFARLDAVSLAPEGDSWAGALYQHRVAGGGTLNLLSLL